MWAVRQAVWWHRAFYSIRTGAGAALHRTKMTPLKRPPCMPSRPPFLPRPGCALLDHSYREPRLAIDYARTFAAARRGRAHRVLIRGAGSRKVSSLTSHGWFGNSTTGDDEAPVRRAFRDGPQKANREIVVAGVRRTTLRFRLFSKFGGCGQCRKFEKVARGHPRYVPRRRWRGIQRFGRHLR